MALVELYADARVRMAHDGALFLCGWADAPELTQMHALGEHGRRVEDEHGPLALLNVAFSGVPKFSDEVRACSAAYTRDATLFARSRAHVVLLPGFRGAAVMAFINTFLLLGRPPRPTKVFRAIEPAIEWTARLLPSHDPGAIAVALEQLRVALPSG